MNHLTDRRHDAFTLMELLVVVAIISLLAGLVVPTLGVLAERAKRGGCAQNLRALQQGMMLYEEEHFKQPRWLAHNFWHYAWNNCIYYGQYTPLSPVGPGYRPARGYSSLGNLAGSNDSHSRQQSIAPNYGGLPSLRPHWKFIRSAHVYYCPSQTDRWIRWVERGLSWSTWPWGANYHSHEACYSMRPGRLRSHNIDGDVGFVVSGSGSYHDWYPSKQYSMQYPQNAAPDELQAVASDATGSKFYLHTGHQVGANVAYRNGAVHWFDDTRGLLTTYNGVSIYDYSRDTAVQQVNIWTAFDERALP